MHLYLSLAQEFIENIQSGKICQGQKMLSIRKLHQQRGYSVTTIKKCYEYLESLGYIHAKPQSGFFVRSQSKPVSNVHLPTFSTHPTEISQIELINEINKASCDTQRVPLGSIQLANDLIPEKQLQQSLIRAVKHAKNTAYMPSPLGGDPLLKAVLCDHFSDNGFHLEKEDLFITNSCMDALRISIDAVSNVGECIAVPVPCYSGHLQLLACMNRRVLEIPSNIDGVDIDALEKTIKSGSVVATLMTSNFQNPLGYTLSNETKKYLAQLAASHQCPIIEDDVFGELAHNKGTPLPIKAWDKDGWVIWCSSFSKTLTEGFRVGWLTGGRHHVDIKKQLANGSFSMNTPLQLAIKDFIQSGSYRKHLNTLLLALAQQLDSLEKAVVNAFPKTCALVKPLGGYSLWVQLPNGMDALAVYSKAQALGINIVPGSIFSNNQQYCSYIRLNAGNPWSETLAQSIDTLALIIKQIQTQQESL